MAYEVKITTKDGKNDWFDPVVKIIIQTEVHSYELNPADLERIFVGEKQ